MIVNLFIIILAAHLSKGATVVDDEDVCEINPLVNLNSPMVISSGEEETFIYPKNGATTISISKSQPVDFVCPGRILIANGVRIPEIVTATCISKDQFSIQYPDERYPIKEQEVKFSEINCATPITRFIVSEETCGGNGKKAEIGYNLLDGRFLRTMELCFDTKSESPLYTKFIVTSSIAANAKGRVDDLFAQDNEFYNLGSVTMEQLYHPMTQRQTINKQIGLDENNIKYIKRDKDYVLSRGHLAAKGDFFYRDQQTSTYRYTNTAPQWHNINGNNWNTLEKMVRKYAIDNNVDLEVYTGVYEKMKLFRKTDGKQTPIYLYADGTDTKLPLPGIFWKVVYDSKNHKAVVLITDNNPYSPYNEKLHFKNVCKDVSAKETWSAWTNRKLIHMGYSYACSIENFRDTVKYAPDLNKYEGDKKIEPDLLELVYTAGTSNTLPTN